MAVRVLKSSKTEKEAEFCGKRREGAVFFGKLSVILVSGVLFGYIMGNLYGAAFDAKGTQKAFKRAAAVVTACKGFGV